MNIHELPLNHPRRREFAALIGPETWDYALAYFEASNELAGIVDALPKHLRQKKRSFPALVSETRTEKPQSFTPSSITERLTEVKVEEYKQRSIFDELSA